ncbi:hypothetical protein SPRG_11579 [Saprolegnia parasitica CBS 223.65]|uniref:Apple domain-containing protein n=1 Tax=Saprolegnia parasitica (strain CBS 223.65) TaxID=695850 RepID=A0A067C128_SAPPC|nr:hypothetical protein SPRG_11579 [Saprolegnia parasitica CBS 223.65]KDO22820.1 hypothetical protein SPRG_11579 [Saprolegnia parasitica CBS 223.65]|eukprot:XP_012206491.1 hypothetical protein SPRG_11579 [Saprolegnia parasitica CBS 223.65]
MRAAVIASYLGLLVATAVHGACSAFDENTDYPGNDIGTTNQAKPENCCADCAAFAGCKAYVWVPRDGGVCLLKSEASGKYPAQGARAAKLLASVPPLTGSCPTPEANTDYPGNDLGRTQRASMDLCCNDCEATEGCARFVYYGGDCILKAGGGVKSRFPGATAASFVPKGSGNTTTPAPTDGTCSVIEEDTDYIGNDIDTTNRAKAEDCCADCVANPNCKVYVWAQGVCILKSANSGKTSSPGARAATVRARVPTSPPMVGCPAIQEDVDYPGNDLTTTYQTTAEFCCADCTGTPGCRGFVWNAMAGACRLKTAVGSPVKAVGNRASVLPRLTTATCSAFKNDVDYPGNDIGSTSRASAADCCGDCADFNGCTLYVWSNDFGGTCYLKNAKSDPSPFPGAKAGVYTRSVAPVPIVTPAPAPSAIQTSVFGTYPSPSVAFAYLPNMQWIPNSKLETGEIGDIDILKPFPLPSPAEMIAAHDAKPKPLLEEGTNTLYFPLSQSVGECAVMTSSSGYAFFTYVPSTQICVVHNFASPTTTTFALFPTQAPMVLSQSLPQDFQLGVDTNQSSTLARCQAGCSSLAACAAVTYTDKTCTFFGPSPAKQAGILAGWVSDPIAWNEVPNSMQYLTMPSRSLDLAKYTTQAATTAKTIGDCAAAALQKRLPLFSFESSAKKCTLVKAATTAATTSTMLINYPASPVVLSSAALATGLTKTSVANAASAADCHKACVPSAAGCLGTTFDASTKRCELLIPAYAPTTTLGWIATSALPTGAVSPSSVHMFVNAHQDDHELFMSANLYDSFASKSTKIVMIYMSAGDAGARDGWYQAREAGTLASAQSFVKLFGLYNPVRKTDVITLLGHQITKVTLGNAVHYFLRLSEDGMSNLPSNKAAAPMDRPGEKYANVAALRAVVVGLMKMEAKGIGNAVVNSQQFKEVDHVLHAMAGQIVFDGVAADATLSKCLSQNYFWGYQRWLDTINMKDPSLTTQRSMWWALHKAIVKVYPNNSPWYDHCQSLGRQYLALNVAGSGKC